MSELVNAYENRMSFRRGLLTTASAIALLGFSYGIAKAADDSGDRPTVWIELGGQLSRLNDEQDAFSAPVMMADRPSMFSPSQEFEKPPLSSIDETGKLSFEPNGSDWVLSASIRYGRSGSNRDERQGTYPKPLVVHGFTGTIQVHPIASKFANTSTQDDEHHLIVDFQAGKDVGLGMFGRGGSSVLNFGIRFAQFGSESNVVLQSDPDWQFHYKYAGTIKLAQQAFHTNRASLAAERSFHGIGPTLSWNASAPFAGNSHNGELSFDGGLGAAVLFGRQRAQIHHQVTGEYRPPVFGSEQGPRYITYQPPAVDHLRARTVTVPNVGGFAGLTYRIENFKMSAGYRADLFFGAMDGGIDTTKKQNVGFYGPFASVSVGIGG
jgi:hypothetical protein